MQYTRKIFGYECDLYGHLNNANYLHLYEEARAVALQDIGLSVNELNSLNWQIYVTRVELDFIKGLALEEVATVKSTVVKISRVSSLWQQEIYDSAGQLCNRALVKAVFIRDGKPSRLDKNLYQKFLDRV
jgi:YbgC/YbaW family acyl-CoA thioester hydrolase